MKMNTAQRKVRAALKRLVINEWRLLQTHVRGSPQPVSERAVAFQFGWHLRSLLEKTWDVDCEYNREGSGALTDIKRSPTARQPDLIVHRRGLAGPENNLLVLELKTNDRQQIGNDGGNWRSVLGLMNRYRYRFGVFLDLRISFDGPMPSIDPHWSWAETPVGPRVEDEQPQPVYDKIRLRTLMMQGRNNERRRYSTTAS